VIGRSFALSLACGLLLAGCATQRVERSITTDAQAQFRCPVSEPARRLETVDGARYPVVFGFGGELAGPVETWSATSATKGWVWLLHTADPPLFAHLRADRLDAADRVDFEVVRAGTTTAPLVWPTGGEGYTYMPTQRDAVLTKAGCWKVSLVGGSAADAVVIWISR